MEERFVRCRRCHDAFDPKQGSCPRCGAEYVVPPDPTTMGDSSYADKYQGTEFNVPLYEAPIAPPANRSGIGVILAIGAVLVVLALALGGMVLMGAFGEAQPTPRNDIVISVTPSPSPSATLPPIVGRTLAQISDPSFNAHVSIRTKLSVNARVTGHSQTAIVNIEADMSGGNEQGTYQTGNLQTEWRIVAGTYYSRQLPSGKWSAKVAIPPFLILSPLFSITDPLQLAYDGPDSAHGAVDRLESTAWWTPDIGKLSGLDVATVGISPQKTSLTLWIFDDGAPVYAEFHAWTDASDGTRLLDILTTYEFTSMGGIVPAPTPTLK